MLWALPQNKLFEYLKSSPQGLTTPEAEERLGEYGQNEVLGKDRKNWREILLSQFRNALVIVLIFAAIASYLLGERINSVVILIIVLINSSLGFVQEYKAERVLRELNKYVTVTATAERSGEKKKVDAKWVVPGDIAYLTAGDIVPADIRLLETDSLTVDESALTGESAPVAKHAAIASRKHSLPQYLTNMAFMGTSVTSGSAKGVVVATGKSTFFGKTATSLKQNFESDFEKSIKKFSNFLLKVIVAMTLFIFAANAFLGKGLFDSFLFAVALAVGITPEVLPVVMTITLANGAMKMAKKKVVIKRLASVEDLGNIDVLCCDKTGTLTDGKFSLQGYASLDGKKDDRLVLYGLLCNSSDAADLKDNHTEHTVSKVSNPIDKAVLESREAKNVRHLLQRYSVIGKNEFDFERRRMSVLVQVGKGSSALLIAKGAPESMLKACKSARIEGKTQLLTKALAARIKKRIERYEKDGYVAIAVASKGTTKRKTAKSDEKGMQLLGLLLFLDPPKKSAKNSLRILQKLMVAIKVISGDSPVVTRKICSEVGLKITENRVVTGEELDRLDEKEFDLYLTRYNVFARVTPQQKYRIVATLNKEGNIVGFLGDGINDAPALKAADVGISVDSGTGVAKEAADIILLQKSLGVLAEGIIEGRKTFCNITKYILNTISANYGNMFTVAATSLFLKFIPLLPSQILLNNFLSDVPMLTVSTDNVDPELLKKPKRWNIKIISEFMLYFGILSTIFDLAFILPLLLLLKASPELLRTAWFIESALSEIAVTFAIRTKYAFFKSKPSKLLVITSIAAGIAALAIAYTNVGSMFFGFVKLPLGVLLFTVAIVLIYFAAAEALKKKFFSKFEV